MPSGVLLLIDCMADECERWRALYFNSLEGEPSTKADALRSLGFTIAQLQAERGETLSHTSALYADKYASIVDSTDTAVGLNNYAEGVLSRLTNTATNESQLWKSSLTVDSMMAMPQVQRMMKCTEKKPPPRLSQHRTLDHSNHQSRYFANTQRTMCTQPPADKLPSTARESNGDINCVPKQKQSHTPVFKFADKHIGGEVTFKKKVPGSPGTDGLTSSSAFVTARHQLITNQRKTNKRVASDSYGDEHSNTRNTTMAKRCLGTRRNPFSKFAPPVRRSDDETNHWQKDGSVTSTVATGSVSSSGGLCGVEDDKLKGLDQKMVDLILNEIVDHGPPVTWEDVAGLEFAKATIKEAVVWPMLRPDLFTGLRGPPKGILLFGPPGTGKTLIGKCIASQAGATFFSISASSLTSKWVGEGEKMVRTLFAVARCQQPAVIFIDEIDSLLTQRCDGEHESSRRIKTEFLVQLDGATTRAEDLVLVVGATNRPQEIDEAARRRLSKRLYIPLPDVQSRLQIMRNLLVQQRSDLTDEELQGLCEKTEGYSGADVTCLCREAALGPIRSIDASAIQHISVDQVRSITCQDFVAAFRHVRSTVSPSDLKSYEEWNRQFGSGASS
ncbi:fidgetin-like protein 1 isoform X2 [Corticium candelabrum]|uniref:fidgetin-like protein 1 isoform X2 n=1 Tax=Corticium candelabrum TaxID=121492 RepID=UPI002E2673F4|nr:fidgetin-like protein 1 isoform X2 [Corticium candelabrum]